MNKQTRGRLALWLLPLLLVIILQILSTSIARAQDREEAIFAFKVGQTSSDFIVYINHDTISVPLDDFLNFVKIYYEVGEERVYSGYVNNRDSSFKINFKKSEYQSIIGEQKSLNKCDWFALDGIYYVSLEFLENCFKVNLKPSFSRLSVPVSASYELPIYRLLNAEYTSNNFRKTISNDSLAPLIKEESFKILNGGSLLYNIGIQSATTKKTYNCDGTLGMQVLGGETQYSINGAYTENQFNYRENYRWRYIMDNSYLTSISLGNLYAIQNKGALSRGYSRPSYAIKGLQVTNLNEKMPVGFTNIIIEDRIDPDWNIELYIDDKLYEARKTDPTGYFRFDIPIKYGSTKLFLKKYGPKGEYEEEDRSYNIDNDLLPAGKSYYGLSGGQDIQSKKYVIDGSLAMGISDWMTTSIYGSKVFDSLSTEVVCNTSFQLLSNLSLNAMASNVGAYELCLKVPESVLGNWEFAYTSFDQKKYSDKGTLGIYNVYGSLGQIFGLPLSINLNGRHIEKKVASTTNANLFLNLYLGVISFNFRYNAQLIKNTFNIGELSQNLLSSATYSLPYYDGYWSIFSRLRISFDASYLPDTRKFVDLGLKLNKNITKNLYLSYEYSYNIPTKLAGMNLSLNFNTDYLRSTGNVEYKPDSDPTYNANITGGVEFDPTYMKLRLVSSLGSNMNNGKSSAAVRFFVDKNFNGKYDEKIDVVVPEVKFNVTNDMATINKVEDCSLVTNLIPGRRYNIRIRTESFNNPAIIPDYTEFSFIAEPFTCSAIDIPCRPGGMIEGNIKYKSDKEDRGQGGVRVHVRSKTGGFETSIAVFSDGSYFYLGVPVGEYEVFVDSMQLAVLRCNSVPEKIDLSVKPTPDGDYIGNLNFTLMPREAGAPRKGDEPLADASVGAKSLRNSQGSPLQDVVMPVGKPQPLASKDTTVRTISPSQPMSKKIDKGFLFDKARAFSGQKRGDFKPDSDLKAYLESLAEYMTANKNCTVSIIGHTDSFGSFAQNTEDAKARSQAAAEYLIGKGIAKTRVYTTSKGALVPVETNDTEDGRAKNRRVEIQVLK